jgi:outer membrane protein
VRHARSPIAVSAEARVSRNGTARFGGSRTTRTILSSDSLPSLSIAPRLADILHGPSTERSSFAALAALLVTIASPVVAHVASQDGPPTAGGRVPSRLPDGARPEDPHGSEAARPSLVGVPRSQDPRRRAPGRQDPGRQDPGRQGADRDPSLFEVSEAAIPTDLEGLEVLQLSLEDALRIGFADNIDLKAEELSPLIEQENVRREQAFFEPEFFGSVLGGQTNQPSQNVFQPSRQTDFTNLTLGLRQNVSTGGQVEVTWNPRILLQTAAIEGFPEQLYTSEFVIRVTQPLLRSAWSDYARRNVRRNETTFVAARNRFDRTVQQTLLDITNAYWELVFAREDYRVVVSALELAQEQLRITMERIRVRELAELDRISDEADVAVRKEELIQAENLIRQREDELRRLIFDDTDGKLWLRNIQPTSPVETVFQPPRETWQRIAAHALADRPDLVALRAEVQAAEIDLEVARRDLLPQLDLAVEYSSDGINPEFNAAFRDSAEQTFNDWNVQLQFAVPLGNQAARATRDRALLQYEQARRRLYALEIDVGREVRDAVRQLRSLSESIVASSESVRLAETNLYTERQRLAIGESTLFEIQQRNQQLREARQRLRRNQVDFRRAEATLDFVRGRLAPPGR